MASETDTSELTAEQARRLLRYEPETGKLYWLERPREMFQTSRAFGTWNTRYAGQEALSYVDGHGYRRGNLLGRTYQSYRVIWLIQTGEWPEGHIDHINGVRDDNRWENLRQVTNAENQRNAKRRIDNKSGVTGVFWSKRRGKWYAQVGTRSALKHLGSFSTIEEAEAARRIANIRYGYSDRHGES